MGGRFSRRARGLRRSGRDSTPRSVCRLVQLPSNGGRRSGEGPGGADSRVWYTECICTRSVPDPPVRAGDEKHTSSAARWVWVSMPDTSSEVSLVNQTLYQPQHWMYYITSTRTEGSGDCALDFLLQSPGMWTAVLSVYCLWKLISSLKSAQR